MSKELTALTRLKPTMEPQERRNKRLSAIRAALAVGHTQSEIARALGVSRQRVSEIIKENRP